MKEPGTCRSCDAAIYWVRTPKGKNMPIDQKSEKRIVLDEPKDPALLDRAEVRDTYLSHFATCPNAAQHRRQG